MKKLLYFARKFITGTVYVAAIFFVFNMVEGRQNEIIVAILLAIYQFGNIRGAASAAIMMEAMRANESQFNRIKWMLGDPAFPTEPQEETPEAVSKRQISVLASMIPELIGLMMCAWVLFIGIR